MLLDSFLTSGTRAMVTSQQGRATAHIVALGVLLIATIAFPVTAQAAFILDDFDDAVNIVLPEMEDESALTEGVGALLATRIVGVGESLTDPIGRVDVSLTRPSHLSARIDGQLLDDPLNTSLLSFITAYDFGGPTDLTQGGASDAVFIEMRMFQGSGIPGTLTVLARDDQNTLFANVSRFSLLSDSPYTLIVPFSSFGFRGGGGLGEGNFSTVDLFEVRLRLLTRSKDPNTNWLFQIDRIRIGRVISEPSTGVLLVFAILGLAFIVETRREFRKVIQDDRRKRTGYDEWFIVFCLQSSRQRTQ